MTRIDALPGANQRTPLWRARLRNDLPGYIFMLPTLAALVAFTLYPLVDTAWLSLTNSNGATGSFIGLANYVTIFTDSDFWMALWNTVYMGVLTLVIGVPLSLVVATLINVVGRTSSVYKALYFSPNVTSAIATPTFIGSPPGSPVTLIRPPRAWTSKSYPGSRAPSPGPNPVIEQ